MKILHTVEFYHPSVGGMQEVVKQLSERLVTLGHQVTVATTASPARAATTIGGVRIEEFAIGGNHVRGFTGETARYETFLRDGDFDIITNFAAQQWATDCALPLLDQLRAKKVFVPTGFSGLYDPAYERYFQLMKTWMLQYDLNIFLSNDYRDIDFARANGVTRHVIIPNGAAADEFLAEPTVDLRRDLGIPPDHLLIAHVGSHTGVKGHAEAIEMFIRAPISKATLLIVANDFGTGCGRACKRKATLFGYLPRRLTRDKRLIVTSLPRVTTVAAYHAADLFLFPSQIESSPLVLFECMASKTPFLTTEVGNAAEIIAWSGGGRLLPTHHGPTGYSRADIAGGTAALAALAAQPHQRRDLAESGFAAWRERFTWEVIAARYETEYRRLLEG